MGKAVIPLRLTTSKIVNHTAGDPYSTESADYIHTGIVVIVVAVSYIQRTGCQPRKKLLYTVAHPARGLLNRENITKIEILPIPPPLPRCSYGVKQEKSTARVQQREQINGWSERAPRDASTCMPRCYAGLGPPGTRTGFLRLVD